MASRGRSIEDISLKNGLTPVEIRSETVYAMV